MIRTGDIGVVRIQEVTSPRFVYVPVCAALVLQGVASLSLHNTAFQDEALYLYAGRQLFTQLAGGSPATDTYAAYFSGAPGFYPLLAGMLDALGGLGLARFFNLLCMLCVTLAVFAVTRRLFDDTSASLAAVLFAVQGPVLMIGHLATCDALSLALLGLASVLALHAGAASRALWPIAAGVALGAATIAKYVAFLWAPTVLALLALWAWQHVGVQGAIKRVCLAVAALITTVFALFAFDPGMRVGLDFTLTRHAVFVSASREILVARVAAWGGGLIGFACIGIALLGLARSHSKSVLLALVLGGAAMIAPASHLWKAEASSLPKHMAFGLFFAAPLAGFALARIGGYLRSSFMPARWLASLAICVALFGVGLYQAQGLFAEWANSDEMVRILRTQVRPNSSRILAEESEVPRYYLEDVTAPWQWTGLYYFHYTDASGRNFTGEDGYRQAIADGYFDLVMLKYGASINVDRAIDSGLRDGSHYDLIARLPYTTGFGKGEYWVWRRGAR